MKKITLTSLALIVGMLSSSHHNFSYYSAPKVTEIKKLPVKEVERLASTHFESQDYEHAYAYYLALSQMKTRLTSAEEYQLGKSALHAKHYDTAKEYLQKAASGAWKSKYPLAIFEYANALKHTGNYQQAMFFYAQYAEEHKWESNSNDYVGIALRHREACSKALKSMSLMAASVTKIGSSFAAEGNTVGITTPSKYSTRLIECQDVKGTCLKKVMPNMEILPLEGMAGDPTFNMGSPYIAPDGETVYFTRREKAANGNPEFKIYTGKITPEGEVGAIQKLNTWVNRDGVSSMYPTISINTNGQEVLYFASTLPGGEGGLDLWYSVRLSTGEFTKPSNMGVRINTAHDELTPFYSAETGELYFSSDKPEGFGGFDVYKMTGEKNVWKESAAAHLHAPINSHADDCFFMMDEAGRGYFSSNRDADNPKAYKLYEHNTIITAQSQNLPAKPAENKK